MITYYYKLLTIAWAENNPFLINFKTTTENQRKL